LPDFQSKIADAAVPGEWVAVLGDQVELPGVQVLARPDRFLDKHGLDLPVVEELKGVLDDRDQFVGDVDLVAAQQILGVVVELRAAVGGVVALLPRRFLERADHRGAAGGIQVLDCFAVVGDVLGDGRGGPLRKTRLVEDTDDRRDAGDGLLVQKIAVVPRAED
jgi:hypothetical protein